MNQEPDMPSDCEHFALSNLGSDVTHYTTCNIYFNPSVDQADILNPIKCLGVVADLDDMGKTLISVGELQDLKTL